MIKSAKILKTRMLVTQVLAAIFFVLFDPTVQALELRQNAQASAGGELEMLTRVICAANESQACTKLCQNATECEHIEPTCLNCAGTDSLFMRLLFTRLNFFYVRTHALSGEEALSRLKGANWIAIAPDSIYNFYRTSTDPQTLNDFKELCGVETNASPLLVVNLDDSQSPESLQFVVCSTITEMKFFVVKPINERE